VDSIVEVKVGLSKNGPTYVSIKEKTKLYFFFSGHLVLMFDHWLFFIVGVTIIIYCFTF